MPYVPPLYPPHGEDKPIIAERERLEIIWRVELGDTERDAWRNYWTTQPPRDAYGRQYVTNTPTVFDALQVRESTAYAWQNIFATYRFGAAHVITPATRTALVIQRLDLRTTADTLTFRPYDDSAADPSARIIFYASPPHAPLQGTGVHRVRPITWTTTTNIRRAWEVFAAYLQRYGTPSAGIITAGVVTLDNNNGAVPFNAIADATYSPP